MRWWWAGAYGAFRKKRPSDRVAKPSGESVVGSTDAVGASPLRDALPLEVTPFMDYAISCNALPSSAAALPPGVFHGRFDLADHPNDVAAALRPLADYIASDPEHANATDREAYMAMLRDALTSPLPVCTKRILVTSRKRFLGPFQPSSTTQLGDILEGAMVAIIKVMDLQEIQPDDIAYADSYFFDTLFDDKVVRGVVESLKIITRQASLRVAEYAFHYAKTSGRGRVSAITKANIMRKTDRLFLECCREVAEKYPEIRYKEVIVDNCCMTLVKNPGTFDVLVIPNLYGDIINDLCAGLIRGLGLTPSCNICKGGIFLAESVHGSAPDISGKTGHKFEDPLAHAVLSSPMDLEHEIPGSFEVSVGRLLHRLGSLINLPLQSLHVVPVSILMKKPELRSDPVSNMKPSTPPLAARTISPLARFLRTSNDHQPVSKKSHTPWLKKVRYMAGRQTLCLIFLLFIVISFISTVNAEDRFQKCPPQSITDYLPRNTCRVIKLSGDHWSHSKRVEVQEVRIIEYHIPNSVSYFFKNKFTWCIRFQDTIQLIGIMSNWPAVWKLRQNQHVKFLLGDKNLIVVWIDISIVGIFYHLCWIRYGHLLSLSGYYTEFGQHVYHINVISCWLFISVLVVVLIRHRTVVKASRFIIGRLLGLSFLVGIFYYLRNVEPDEKNISRVGAIGFGAMILMYIMKSFTIVGVKVFTMTVHIVAMLLFPCCEHHHLSSWYGCASIGSLVYRFIETTRFCYLFFHQERLPGGRLHGL